jgi:hypothetical protein
MTLSEKKDISCKNNIGIIRNLEIRFQDENFYNYNNITFIGILQSYVSSMKTLFFLTILKLFKMSGLQTKMAFKQRFKY